MNSEGVEVKPLRELTGNAMFNTVFIDDVFVPDELVLGEVDRGWEVSRNTLTNERVSIGSSEPPFLASLDQFVEFVRDGQFDQIEQNRGRQADRRGPRRQAAQHALDAADAGRRRPDARGGHLQAAVDEDRPGLRRVRGVVVRHRRGDRRSRASCPASGPSTCWPAARRRSTAAPPRCSSTSSPSGCSACPAIRKSLSPSRRECPRIAGFRGPFVSARGIGRAT